MDAPVLKDLTINAAVRADKYSDLGESTINPKVSLRWQPTQTLLLRGSAGTAASRHAPGFSALPATL